MSIERLVEKMVSRLGEIPATADILETRQYTLDDVEERARHFLALAGEVNGRAYDSADWQQGRNRTLVRLPLGARAVIYHASGAMKLVSGLEPMAALFPKLEERDTLVNMVEEMAERFQIKQWAGEGQLRFERLWQVKAAAADRQGILADPVLCRVVGAYRHFVAGLPVWGPASVSLKLANRGQLDSLAVLTRETTGEVVDKAEIVAPERGATDIAMQLAAMMPRNGRALSDFANPRWLRFGYFSLPKRQTQRLLAPVYVAAIDIEHEEGEAQGYVLLTAATEKAYLPLGRYGHEAAVAQLSRPVG